jgi:hypothetical protein
MGIRDTLNKVKEGASNIANKVQEGAADLLDRTGDILKGAGSILKNTIDEIGEPMAVKETKDVIAFAVGALGAAKRAGADGWQITDAGLLIKDQQLMNLLVDALEGAPNIPKELTTIRIGEALELFEGVKEGLEILKDQLEGKKK